MENKEEKLRKNVLEAVKEYYDEIYKNEKPYSEGERINYLGRCFDEI